MTSRWSVLAASAVGRAHARAGIGCQDAHALAEIDDCLLLAVADGASSAPLAAVGAPLAAALAIRVFGAQWRAGPPADGARWRTFLSTGLAEVLRQFHRVADTAGTRGVGDLASTLTVVVVRRPWVGVAAIGDGFVVIRSGDGNLDLLLPPPDGIGRAVGATTFVTSPDALEGAQLLVGRIPDLTGVAVSSDGMDTLMIKYVGGRAERPGESPFDQLFGWAGQPDGDEMRLARLLASGQVCQLTEDDKTLVVAVPRSARGLG